MSAPRRNSIVCWPIHASGLVVCLLLVFAAFFVVWQPLQHRREAVRVQREQLNAGRQDAELAESNVRRLQAQLQQVTTDLESSRVSLRPSDQLNVRVSQILDLAVEASLAIDGSKSGEVLPGQHFDAVPLHLTGRGTYPDCARFLYSLSETMPDFRLVALSLTSNRSGDGTTCAFEFEFAWYAASSMAHAP